MTPPRRRYPTDLTDAEWQLLGPFILAPRPGGHLHDDKARVHHPMRSIDVRFRTPVQQSGKTATGIQAEQVIQALASGKRPAVKVKINGCTYRSTVAVMGGVYMVGVNADNRAPAPAAPRATRWTSTSTSTPPSGR